MLAFAKQIADEQHLNVAIEPRVTEAEIRAFGGRDDPTPLFEIIEARTQEIQAVIEEAGILSDRIRRRGAPPWDYEDYIDEDPEFLDRYYESRRASYSGVEVSISQNPFLFTVRFADPLKGLISGLGGIVLRSDDGGAHLALRGHRPQAGALRGAAAADPRDRGGREGPDAGLRRRRQRAGTSSAASRPSSPSCATSHFDPDDRVGYIVGQRGTVLRSEDSGQTWQQMLPPPTPTTVATSDH